MGDACRKGAKISRAGRFAGQLRCSMDESELLAMRAAFVFDGTTCLVIDELTTDRADVHKRQMRGAESCPEAARRAQTISGLVRLAAAQRPMTTNDHPYLPAYKSTLESPLNPASAQCSDVTCLGLTFLDQVPMHND